jgi:MFS family permease
LAIAAKANPLEVSSWTWIIVNVGAAVSMIIFALLTQTLGRKGAFILTSVLSIPILPIIYIGITDYRTLYAAVILLGIVSGGFGVFAVWFPEMFPTHLRSSGASFCFNVGRIASAAGPFIGGSLVAFFGSFPKAACAMGASFIVGLIAVIFAPETKGKPLPE